MAQTSPTLNIWTHRDLDKEHTFLTLISDEIGTGGKCLTV